MTPQPRPPRKRACSACKANRHEPALWLSTWHALGHPSLKWDERAA